MENLFYYRHNIKKFQIETPFHYMSCHEITAVFDGVLEYKVNGVAYPIKKGDIIYVQKGASRYRRPVENADYISLNFFSDQTYDFPTFFEKGLTEIVRNLLRSIDSIYQCTHNFEDERFSLLLSCLLKQLNTQLKAEKEHPLVFKIKNFIKNNLSEKITLDAISAYTFFSAVHCETIFKKETGVSIINYALNEKISMAKKLLIEGSFSLNKISEILGFSDYNYFSRLFKKQTGVSPLAYKKMKNEEEL